MTTYDNAPPPDEWETDPRPCPIPCDVCRMAETTQQAIWMHGDNVILGDN